MQYGNFWTRTGGASSYTRFKSYYVVWKLCMVLLPFYFIFQFKSYYVVWKLAPTAMERTIQIGLNRTMQYGNDIRTSGKMKKIRGLNRTMQYGNPKYLLVSSCIDVFKSYYVVWKLRYLNTDLGQAQSLNRTMQYGNPRLSEKKNNGL